MRVGVLVSAGISGKEDNLWFVKKRIEKMEKFFGGEFVFLIPNYRGGLGRLVKKYLLENYRCELVRMEWRKRYKRTVYEVGKKVVENSDIVLCCLKKGDKKMRKVLDEARCVVIKLCF